MPANVPYVVHLDRRYELLGVYNSGTNLTTWTLPYPDATVDTIVFGEDFGLAAGYYTAPTSVAGTSVTKMGRYDAGMCIIGHAFTAVIKPTRPFVRDQNGASDIRSYTAVRDLVTAHHRTGHYTVNAAMSNRADRSRAFNAAEPQEYGTLRSRLIGRADQNVITIESDDPRPFAISGLEWLVDFNPRA